MSAPMSHKLFHHSILSNARVWDFLKKVDAAEAEACREAGCPHCGGALHSATYPRKPHGLAADLRDDVRRFSLCCSVCRRRVKPPSVRFFGSRFYVGALFLLVSALALAGGVRLQTIARRWRIPASTLRRWRRWWRETFPLTPEWAAKRGDLAAAPGEPPLRRLLRMMRGRGLRARLRFAVVGPLLASPPPAGQLRAELERQAEREWEHPSGTGPVRFAVSTIER